jgi:hypothetical protein
MAKGKNTRLIQSYVMSIQNIYKIVVLSKKKGKIVL